MQIIHRLSVSSSPELRRELAALGIVVGSGGILTTFEVSEEHESWSKLQRWIAARQPVDLVSTRFSPREITEAAWLELVPDWHWGNPQPDEDEFGYLSATYDTSQYCAECGNGLTQKAPFQMKGEPKWGRNSILQLNWVFDEYFVTPELWKTVFESHGIACRPVLNVKGVELRTVVQLDVQLQVDVATEGLDKQVCRSCGRLKYLPVVRGCFPAIAEEARGPMTRTKQFFGSGATAHRGVLISQRLVRLLVERKARGASFKPVAPTAGALQY